VPYASPALQSINNSKKLWRTVMTKYEYNKIFKQLVALFHQYGMDDKEDMAVIVHEMYVALHDGEL